MKPKHRSSISKDTSVKYRIPAFHIALSENSSNKKIQIFRSGTFHHPEYGQFQITKELLSEIKKNFDSKTRGIDIMVDYKHESNGEAAGWFKELELAQDGNELWASIDWTPTGEKVLSDKEFRYISPEFTFDYQDNETLKKHGPVLLGAGLTNRPVIKNMDPVVELSEMKYEEKKQTYGENNMSPEEMMKELEALKAENAALKEKLSAAMGEKEKMMEEKKMAEKKASFQKLMSEGKAIAAQEESFLKDDMVKFVELAQPVKLTETGHKVVPAQASDESSDVDDKIIKLAEELKKSGKAKTISEAYMMVLRDNKELMNEKYN